MGRPLRFFQPHNVYFISGRCLQARFFLRPSEKTQEIIGGVLAKALDRFDIELFAFVFISNHFHCLVRSESLQIPDFMQYFRGNLAKKLGQHVEWTGKFWDRRYDAEPVLDNDSLVGRLRYILAHGVKEGLVAYCKQWPGLSSLPELLEGKERSFVWPGAVGEEAEVQYPLKVSPLPCWEDFDKAWCQTRVAELVEGIEAEYRAQRKGCVLGVAAVPVLAQRPHDKPKEPKNSPRPLCHASTDEARVRYREEYKEFLSAYAAAREEYLWSGSVAAFPMYSYHPPGRMPVLACAA